MADIPCAGAVVHDRRGRLLMVQRAHEPAAGRWSVPGGRVEPGETLEQACAREVLEETGIGVVVGRLLGTVHRAAPSGGTYVIHDFAAAPLDESDASPTAGDDAASARWVSRSELLALPLVDGLVEALSEWDSLPR